MTKVLETDLTWPFRSDAAYLVTEEAHEGLELLHCLCNRLRSCPLKNYVEPQEKVSSCFFFPSEFLSLHLKALRHLKGGSAGEQTEGRSHMACCFLEAWFSRRHEATHTLFKRFPHTHTKPAYFIFHFQQFSVALQQYWYKKTAGSWAHTGMEGTHPWCTRELRIHPHPPCPPSSSSSTKRQYYKVLLPWQNNRVGTETQSCCLNVCRSVATVHVTEFRPAISTSRWVVLIGCLNWRPCHSQSQFVYVIFKNTVYRGSLTHWEYWYEVSGLFGTAARSHHGSRGVFFMLYKIIVTLKLVLIQFDGVFLLHLWFIRGATREKNMRQNGEKHARLSACVV